MCPRGLISEDVQQTADSTDVDEGAGRLDARGRFPEALPSPNLEAIHLAPQQARQSGA